MKPLNSMLPQKPPVSALNISDDGYVRLTLSVLQRIPLYHLCSGLDEAQHNASHEGASETEISGYTEWVSQTSPALSIGWDWQFSVTDGTLVCISIGQPYSNIMLQTSRYTDLGQDKTLALLAAWIETLEWQEKTQNYINQKYT